MYMYKYINDAIARTFLFYLRVKQKIHFTPYCNVKENEDIVKEKSKVCVVYIYIDTYIYICMYVYVFVYILINTATP